MAQYYYIGPWVWHTALEPEGECWAAPEGTVGAIDLRSLAACGLRGVVQGYGLFASDRLLKAPYLPLGTDLDARLDVVQKGGLEQNLSVPLGATTLRNALVELFTQKADPDQVRMCAGLGVKRDGTQEIWLAGQRIWSKRFQGVTDPAWPMVQAKYQRAYRSMRTQALVEAAATRALREGTVPDLGTVERSLYLRVAVLAAKSKLAFGGAKETLARYAEETHLRYLSTLVEKMSLDPRLFVPGDLPYEGLREPDTVYTESFNKADSSTLGPDQTWTEYVSGSKDLEVYDNALRMPYSGTDNGFARARAEADLSSADHYAQLNCTGVHTANYHLSEWGTAVRYSASADTCYAGWMGGNGGNPVVRGCRTKKVIGGAQTNLGSFVADAWNVPCLLKFQADGDTLTLYLASVSKIGLTDTSITTGTRAGVHGWLNQYRGPHTGDDWEGGDLGAPPAGAVGLMLKETELGNSLLRGLIHAA